jgi:hypothetical protein
MDAINPTPPEEPVDRPAQCIFQTVADHQVAIVWLDDNSARVSLYRQSGERIGVISDFSGVKPSVTLAGEVCNYHLSQPNPTELVITVLEDDVPVQRLTLEIEQRSVRIKDDRANYDRPELN